jgi:hypothetical protein
MWEPLYEPSFWGGATPQAPRAVGLARDWSVMSYEGPSEASLGDMGGKPPEKNAHTKAPKKDVVGRTDRRTHIWTLGILPEDCGVDSGATIIMR